MKELYRQASRNTSVLIFRASYAETCSESDSVSTLCRSQVAGVLSLCCSFSGSGLGFPVRLFFFFLLETNEGCMYLGSPVIAPNLFFRCYSLKIIAQWLSGWY
jgi:hypothetical protein